MLEYREITKKVVDGFYRVHGEIGSGFLEKVYENALAFELREAGLNVVQQAPIVVRYRGVKVGEYFADLLINNCIIVELKACEEISDAHLAQLVNYLKATHIEVGLLLNFGPNPQVKRRIVQTSR